MSQYMSLELAPCFLFLSQNSAETTPPNASASQLLLGSGELERRGILVSIGVWVVISLTDDFRKSNGD